ncbi:uncharacterized protein K441DRAFT_163947 [Cenococcum geophilum 1.58]|uniref:uncharacterized protein n=1 Tax=Cenococcum geophilum 1.58 TaxID=794803 RepID=UPI00358F51B8|nr:hypothetical protein K441DRAFT_163947 [Cenococcum geophilum 1.58]
MLCLEVFHRMQPDCSEHRSLIEESFVIDVDHPQSSASQDKRQQFLDRPQLSSRQINATDISAIDPLLQAVHSNDKKDSVLKIFDREWTEECAYSLGKIHLEYFRSLRPLLTAKPYLNSCYSWHVALVNEVSRIMITCCSVILLLPLPRGSDSLVNSPFGQKFVRLQHIPRYPSPPIFQRYNRASFTQPLHRLFVPTLHGAM